jgi:hypothetical protein
VTEIIGKDFLGKRAPLGRVWAEIDGNIVAVEYETDPLRHPLTGQTGRLIDGVLTCPCGGTEFRYEERYRAVRRQEGNADGVLTFVTTLTADGPNLDEGDNTPGVVCTACDQSPLLPPDVSVTWS